MFNGTTPDMLRQIGDKVKEKENDVVAVFAGVSEERNILLRMQ